MDASFGANDGGYSSAQPDGLASRRSPLHEIELIPRDISRFESLLAPAQGSTLSDTFDSASQRMAGRTLWHVNSTSQGGGVAEILQSVLTYLKGSRIATRWCVVEGDDEFFAITKRIHHFLHGSSGDAGALGMDEKTAYLHTLESQTRGVRNLDEPRRRCRLA